jgi:hypothetical protein
MPNEEAPDRLFVDLDTQNGPRTAYLHCGSWGDRVEYIRADAQPLAVMAMREAAAKLCDERGAHEQRCFGLGREAQNYFRARDAIRAIPLPFTPAQLLAAALAVPEVARVIAAYDRVTRAKTAYAQRRGDDETLVLSLACVAADDELAAALAALKGADHE